MDRRKFLTASGASIAVVAGCLASGDGSSGDPSDGSDDDSSDNSNNSFSMNSNDDSTDEQLLYAVSDDEAVTKSPLQHDLAVKDGDLHDPDTPLRVEVTITNTGDKPLTYGERRQALFWSVRSENGFTLLPEEVADTTDSLISFDEDVEYWVMDDHLATTDDYQVGELEPDESNSETLLVVVDYQEEPPEHPPEEVAFNTEYRVSTEADSLTEKPPAEWGFTLKFDSNEDRYVAREDDERPAFPLQYEADLIQNDMLSPDEPMQLKISITNESDESLTYGERRTALFWGAYSDGVALYPKDAVSDDDYELDDDSGLWIATEEFVMTMDYQTDSLEPGETHSETHLVLMKPDEKGDYPETPPTDLTFETFVSIEEADDESIESLSGDWSVTLESEEH